MGEKFASNVATGTGTFTIPIPTSPGRAGFGPALALDYDSAGGNGPFGFGWAVHTPFISRRTDRGLPLYNDGDTFFLTGSEDLVPIPAPPDTQTQAGYSITRFRARVEDRPVRIERWIRDDGDTHWRVLTAENIHNTYGADAASRISDPADPSRVFSWLLSYSRDDRGNVIAYTYRADDGTGVLLSLASEANRGDRDDSRRTVNRYLKSIRYGNRKPFLDDAGRRPRFVSSTDLDAQEWLFELVLDYGEHDANAPEPGDGGDWLMRADPFSTYRAGFEVRTTRLCRRFLMFHHIPDTPHGPGYDGLVRSLELAYTGDIAAGTVDAPVYSSLRSVTQHGHRRDGAGYVSRSLPPVEFTYSEPRLDPQVRELETDSSGIPAGLLGFEWADLHGEGIPGLLRREPGAWYYLRNESPLSAPRAAFSAAAPVANLPSLRAGGVRILDLAGDGLPDLVELEGPLAGLFEHDEDESWEAHRPFTSVLPVPGDDPSLRLVDLDGDARADALVSAGDRLWWHPSLGEAGFGERLSVDLPADEEQGPSGGFGDQLNELALADMSGDGMADLVRIRAGEVCYWPNLGRGRFGSKVTMDRAPLLDDAEHFDPRRVRLADIDGSGTTDLVYLHREGVRLVFNQSGNGWGDPVQLAFPSADDSADVQVLDLLGTGTAALVWSSPLAGAQGRALRYVQLLAEKPHLLVGTTDNLGSRTEVAYAPSTRFAVADRMAGRTWTTRLPFCVHVVERVDVHDLVGRTRFTSTYRYHEGCFDREEREFAGFGMVETIEADERMDEDAATPWRPPTLTRTWHHCGDSPLPGDWPAGQGWEGDPDGTLSRKEAPAGTSLRALRGRVLQTEVYGLDGSAREGIPYQVVQSVFSARELQAGDAARPAVTRAIARESLTATYEREAGDPRVRHDFTLEVDDFGAVRRALSVAYGRRSPHPEPGLSPADAAVAVALQATPVLRATAAGYTDPLVDPALFPDTYRAPLPARTTVAALYWPGLPASGLTTWDDAQTAWTAAVAAPADGDRLPERDLDPLRPGPAAGWRVTEDRILRYRSDDLTTLLPPGTLEARALPGQEYVLALTGGQAQDVLGELADAAALGDAGYVRLDGETGWWAPQGEVGYTADPADPPATELQSATTHFFLPRRLVDAFGGVGSIEYDPCDLLRVSSTDPVGNVSRALLDFRVLGPRQVTEPSGSRSEAAFDALGLPVGVALLGTAAEPTGDSLAGFEPDLAEADIVAISTALDGTGAAIEAATSRTVSDRTAFLRTRDDPFPTPVCTVQLNRRQHAPDDPAGADLQIAVAHIDGLGNEVQRKTQAEAGPLADGGAVAERWVGSSWVILDRAGDPAQTFEPFFSAGHRFESDRRVGFATTVVRDPLRRVIGRLHPDDTWEKTVIAAWRQESWDRVDTVTAEDYRTDPVVGPALSRLLGDAPDAYVSWRRRRLDGDVGETPADVAAEQDAATKASLLAGTPAVSLLDAAGGLCAALADAGPDGVLASRMAVDLAGRPLAVVDPLGRTVVEQVVRSGAVARNGLDGLGRTLVRATMDSGRHLTLPAADGHPARTLDAHGVRMRWLYDAARRPTHLFARPAGGTEVLLQRWVYGEGVARANAAGRIYRVYDSSGMRENSHYDHQGDITEQVHRTARAYRDLPDWSPTAAATTAAAVAAGAEPLLEPGEYRKRTWYDAIGRPVQTTTPASAGMATCVLRYGHGAGGLLERLDVWLHVAAPPAGLLDPDAAGLHVVTGTDYDASGRMLRRERGNGTVTEYRYDPRSTRLASLTTIRSGYPADQQVVQALAYTHDPAGNVTRIRDTADLANVVFFRNRRVEPGADYGYDHLYRLVTATGREHAGLVGGVAGPPTPPGPSDAPRTGLVHPGDGNALVTYTETYRYDAVGNLAEIAHATASGGWRQGYAYDEPSVLEPARSGNRLSATGPAAADPATWAERCAYGPGGETTALPQLATMRWDLGDRLASTGQQVVVVPGALPEITYYSYDGDGLRTRLTVDRAAAAGADPTPRAERILLPGLEIDRELAADGTATAVRETLRIDIGEDTVALVETRTSGADAGPSQLVRHQYRNHLGSTTLELAADAAVISYEEYFPYGGTSYAAARNALETAKRDRWLGKRRDATGLVSIGVRYYAPWLGRWLSPDPTETADGLNVYVYAGGNPITLRDQDGRAIEAYYIAPGRPGNQPFMWFLGVAAHRLIAYHYEGSHLNEKDGIYTNYIPISTILTDAEIGDPSRLSASEQNAKPDITNVDSREVFEIKPWNSQGEADARKEVKDYQSWLNKGMGVPPGGRGRSGPAKYPFLLGQGASGQLAVQFQGGRAVWRLVWKTTEDGVILYKWQKTSKTDRDEIKEAGEGQWVDITEADAQALGKEVHDEVERGLGRRQTLFKTMEITNTVQSIVGAIASTVIMSAMMSQLRTNLAPRPGVPAPAPGIRPVTPPPPPPPAPVPAPPANVPPPWMLPPPGGTPPPTIRPGL
ncbi:hypothetical protein NMQ03_09455 [Arthrobacter sp. DNA4]|uniref:SpvB/TcaC N-terminal domain-containing protein n=1 Tax=Arthrobacter sp. DNA4 TaxID=2963432 RepID=UPI0020CF78FC|nr:SpvB/TcaC N-terminal domain-containing protein [Arthrobacter sp. DNA4]UTT71280.1 hypothetical protein NMQ03_09455 [Arthrobacter sp. DNA4]